MLDRLQVAVDYVVTDNSLIDKINNSLKKITKVAGVAGLALAGMAVKTGLSEAMDLEGFRLTLETVTKDVTKAKELMQWGSEFANATPFENKEIVEGITKLTSYGMTAKDVLPKVGDMASVMGKSLDQAVEAIADAQTGSMERMKEFGITKDMIIDQAKEMRLGLIVNNKGQITDQAKFNEAMFALMDSKFKGGMEKQAKTMKGLWSTVTGTTKNALAEIVGITADGTIKQGSLFENVKIAITKIITKLNEWSADGTFQKISEQVTEVVTNISNFIEKLTSFTSWIKNASDGAVIFSGVIIGIATAVGLYTTAVKIHHGWTVLVAGAQALWNAALNANPIGLIIAGLAGLIAGLVYAYNHSETFRMYVDAAWATIKEFGAEIAKLPERIKQMWGNGIEKVKEFWGKIQELWASINENPFAKFALDILALTNPITTIMRHFDKLKEAWNWVKDKVGLGDDKNTTTTKTTATKPIGSHRTGESFVKNDGMYKLHYGERVLTKAENSQYSQGGVSQSPSINISINAVQELGNEIKRAIQPIVETTIKNYQTKQLMKMGIAGGQ